MNTGKMNTNYFGPVGIDASGVAAHAAAGPGQNYSMFPQSAACLPCDHGLFTRF